MRGTTSMSPALLRGAAEAPEGLLRHSDRTACGTARRNGRKPETTAVLHAYGVGLGVSGEPLGWIDDNHLVRPARSDPRRRRENDALRAQVPVAASLEGVCFRRTALAAACGSRCPIHASGRRGRPPACVGRATAFVW